MLLLLLRNMQAHAGRVAHQEESLHVWKTYAEIELTGCLFYISINEWNGIVLTRYETRLLSHGHHCVIIYTILAMQSLY